MRKINATWQNVLPWCFFAVTAFASEDEIQVYVDDMNKVGQFGVELHMNYVPQGETTPESPSGIPSNHRWQFTPEFAYGITPSLEAGLYIPTALTSDGHLYATGLRPRLKYIHQPEKPSIFFWGFNTEFGYSSRKVTDTIWAMELRPIMGIHTERWLFSFNPIVNLPLSQGGLNKAAFEPALKIARSINPNLELGIEHYSGYGALNRLQGYRNEDHTVFAVADIKTQTMEINFGIGRGYHNAEDRWVVKSIIAFSFN